MCLVANSINIFKVTSYCQIFSKCLYQIAFPILSMSKIFPNTLSFMLYNSINVNFLSNWWEAMHFNCITLISSNYTIFSCLLIIKISSSITCLYHLPSFLLITDFSFLPHRSYLIFKILIFLKAASNLSPSVGFLFIYMSFKKM